MNPDIEKILLAQAAREAEQGPKLSDSVALGAGGGAAIGAALGTPINAIQGMFGKRPLLKPGPRMAGGLVGALIGGGLGAIAQQQAIRETGEAGALLAKIQSQGGMSAQDELMMERVLRDAYTQQGLLG
jgi:hypothetical protein